MYGKMVCPWRKYLTPQKISYLLCKPEGVNAIEPQQNSHACLCKPCNFGGAYLLKCAEFWGWVVPKMPPVAKCYFVGKRQAEMTFCLLHLLEYGSQLSNNNRKVSNILKENNTGAYRCLETPGVRTMRRHEQKKCVGIIQLTQRMDANNTKDSFCLPCSLQ